ncbi:MAG: undecaprenyl-diphosphate phosphatase [Candidatus Adiutrix sp.]|jgi:undecaprenyl-diphosphatase|nr:undecaprenyl-diphosphate phosphatase [Candidatus Adiutrix sp.]
MPETLTAVILGFLQGLTEFLPVSSSGHLILAQAAFGLAEPELAFDVVLHLGTLMAVFIFYRTALVSLVRELRFLPGALVSPARLRELYQDRPDFRFGLLIIVGSLPTALIGLFGKGFVESHLASPGSVGVALLATGFMLRLIGGRGEGGRDFLTVKDALFIGLVQGLAITPGLSRSGWTIGAGLWAGLERRVAARYSFILSVPAILGATILELKSGLSGVFSPGDFLAGFLTAALCGFLALRLLSWLLEGGRFAVFSWWCWAVGLAALALAAL